MIKVFQWNTCGVASNGTAGSGGGFRSLMGEMVDLGVDVGLFQETGVRFEKCFQRGWFVRSNGRATVVCSPNVRAFQLPQLSKVLEGVVDVCGIDAVVEGGHRVRFVSVYRPGGSDGDPSAFVDWLRCVLFESPYPVVIGGDFNIKCRKYGAMVNGSGGRRLEELLLEVIERGGCCLNDGTPTWIDFASRKVKRTPSTIDYSIVVPSECSGNLGRMVACGWRVGPQDESDHCRVEFTLLFPTVTADIDSRNSGMFGPCTVPEHSNSECGHVHSSAVLGTRCDSLTPTSPSPSACGTVTCEVRPLVLSRSGIVEAVTSPSLLCPLASEFDSTMSSVQQPVSDDTPLPMVCSHPSNGTCVSVRADPFHHSEVSATPDVVSRAYHGPPDQGPLQNLGHYRPIRFRPPGDSDDMTLHHDHVSDKSNCENGLASAPQLCQQVSNGHSRYVGPSDNCSDAWDQFRPPGDIDDNRVNGGGTSVVSNCVSAASAGIDHPQPTQMGSLSVSMTSNPGFTDRCRFRPSGSTDNTSVVDPCHSDVSGRVPTESNSPLLIHGSVLGCNGASVECMNHSTSSSIPAPPLITPSVECHVTTSPLQQFTISNKAIATATSTTIDEYRNLLEASIQTGHCDVDGVESLAKTITEMIQWAAYKVGFLRLRSSTKKAPRPIHAYGWTPDCREALEVKRECLAALRELDHIPEHDRDDGWERKYSDRLSDWKTSVRELKGVILRTKRTEWQQSASTLRGTTPAKKLWTTAHRLSGKGRSKTASLPPFVSEDGTRAAFSPTEQAEELASFWKLRSSFDHPDNDGFSNLFKSAVESALNRPDFFSDGDSNATAHHDGGINNLFDDVAYQNALQRMRDSAPGGDAIVKRLIQWGGEPLQNILLVLFNLSWATGTIPKIWKDAVIIPLPKKVDAASPSHYRPVSLLAFLGKMFEQMVHARLSHAMWMCGAISPEQFGFQSHCSTVHQLVRLTQAVREAWADDCDLAFLSFDIARAFDTVWGDGLLYRLHSLGIRGRMLRWLRDFMSDRYASVMVDGVASRQFPKDLGVPQGSVLGPLLWLIYFDPVFRLAKGNVKTGGYADDFGIYVRVPRAGTGRVQALADLQCTVDAMLEWARLWRLTFEPTKTTLIRFTPIGNNNQQPNVIGNLTSSVTNDNDASISVRVGDHVIAETQPGIGVRYLGVWFDANLTFHDHITRLVVRATERVRFLRHVSGNSWGADRNTLRLLYTAWVRPVLEYASPVWADIGSSVLLRLDKVQNEALRAIVGANKAADLHALHVELGIEHLAVRRLQAGATLAAQLSRITPSSNACAAEWLVWQQSHPAGGITRKRLLALWPSTAYRMVRVRSSPFAFLQLASQVMRMHQEDTAVEPLAARDHVTVADGGPFLPWCRTHTSQSPSIPILLAPWPRLKSAGKRSHVEEVAARVYGGNVISELVDIAAGEHRNLLVAYTDGSAFPSAEGGGGGSGVAWASWSRDNGGGWHDGRGMCFPSGMISTNFLSELYAIVNALEGAEYEIEKRGWTPHDTRLVIFSDCQSAINLISAGPSGMPDMYWSYTLRAARCVSRLKEHGLRVSMEWIPAHVGLKGNERADALAKEAAAVCRTTQLPGDRAPKPYQLIKNVIKHRTRQLEVKFFHNVPKGKRFKALCNIPLTPAAVVTSPADCRVTEEYLRSFEKPVRDAWRLEGSRMTRTAEVAISRLRIGNEVDVGVRTRLGMHNADRCPDCGGPDGTTSHRLVECSKHSNAREELATDLLEVSRTLKVCSSVLLALEGVQASGRSKVINAFAKYLRSTRLDRSLTKAYNAEPDPEPD